MPIFGRKKQEAERIMKHAGEYRSRLNRAIWASAVIVRIDQPAMASADLSWRIVNLTLKVTLQTGQTYITRTTWKVQFGSLTLLQPGIEISIKIDASDPNIIYPNITGAEYLIQYRA